MMFWHITKREIYDNMTSLRFGFTLVLLISLMIMNAAIFVNCLAAPAIGNARNALEVYTDRCRSKVEKARKRGWDPLDPPASFGGAGGVRKKAMFDIIAKAEARLKTK